jgi:hypothetical protein
MIFMESELLIEQIQRGHLFDSLRVQAGNYRSRSCNLLPEEYWIKLKLIKKDAVLEPDQLTAKTAWCFETIGEIQDKFLSSYICFLNGEFYKGWCKLEECEILIKSLDRHFLDTNDEFGIEHIRVHVKNFQDIFPYTKFFSPSYILRFRCSICNKLITPRGKCQHYLGDIYDGVMCSKIAEVIKINEISIVENPVQKSSVVFPNGEDNYNYDVVRYVVKKLNSPWQPWKYEKSKKLIKKYTKIGRNESCPCGSGIKFKKCCLNKKIEMDHYDLIF